MKALWTGVLSHTHFWHAWGAHCFVHYGQSLSDGCINFYETFTVKYLNSGHIGDRTLVHCTEVVPISEVDGWPHPQCRAR